MDPHTSLVLAAILGGFVSTSEPAPMFYGCETTDQGGYLTFVDPTCPAQFTTATADYDPVTGEPLDNK